MRILGATTLSLCVICVCLTTGPAFALGTPMTMNHQGVVKVGSQPFTGNGDFRFAIIYNSPGGAVNKWTNDGSQVDTSEMPDAAVTLAVANGHYSVNLGDSMLGMMMIDAYLFASDPLMSLRIWFDDKTHGPQLLAPDQLLTTVPYAFYAEKANSAAFLDPDAVYSHNIVNGEVYANDLHDGAALAEILDDDGAGSGLDADTLDTRHASDFASMLHQHSADQIVSGTLPNDRYDAYDNLSANDKIGEYYNQLARGSHVHSASSITSGTLSYDRFDAYMDLELSGRIGTVGASVASGNHTHSSFAAAITVPQVNYTSPRTHHLPVPIDAFTPHESDAIYRRHVYISGLTRRTGLFIVPGSPGAFMSAPVALPQGARVTGLTANFYKTPGYERNGYVQLQRHTLDGETYDMALAGTTSVSGFGSVSDSSIGNATIDNVNYMYSVMLGTYGGTSDWGDKDIQLMHVVLTYTLSTAL